MVTLAESSTRGGAAHPTHGMPRILEAVVRVLVRDGLDGLSVRRVAHEAGVSIGAVQHHFANKDTLLRGAADHVTSTFMARAQALTREAHAQGGSHAAFETFCLLLANAEHPATDATDTDASVVWLWYAAKATRPGPVAEAFRAGWSDTESFLRGHLADLHPHLDAAVEAGHLLAVLDGLAVARAAEPDRMPAHRAADIVRRHLGLLSGASPVDGAP